MNLEDTPIDYSEGDRVRARLEAERQNPGLGLEIDESNIVYGNFEQRKSFMERFYDRLSNLGRKSKI